jgi:hypothetical protein
VSVVLSERDPDRRGMREAIPCHRCPHYLAQAQTLLTQRRVRLGPLGRQILTLAREHSSQCYPLTAALRTELPQRVDLRRVHKAVQALVALRAVRTFCLPAVLPRADHPQQLALRETLWVQVTMVGEILSERPGGRHQAGWRKHHDTRAAHFRMFYNHLAATDLFACYVEQVVAIVTAVTHQLIAATDAVMVKRCTTPDSPYVHAFTHLGAVAPDACTTLQQMYLRAQNARRRAIAQYQTAARHYRTSQHSTVDAEPNASGLDSRGTRQDR